MGPFFSQLFQPIAHVAHQVFGAIGAFLLQYSWELQMAARAVSIFAAIMACLALCTLWEEAFGRRHPGRFWFSLATIGGSLFTIAALLTLPMQQVAEVFLIILICTLAVICLVLLLIAPHLEALMTAVKSDCEMANNLTFLQGEMMRAQLEALNDRIRKSSLPQEKEITETMLKGISPVVMLFLRKEKSVVQWSMAAVNLGKNLMQYFWSPKK